MIIAGAGKPFGRYWTATFLADFSDGIRVAAFPLPAVSLTRAPLAVVTVTAIQPLPWLLLGPGIGVLADRVDLRRLMVVVDVARVLVTGALALAVMAETASLTMLYAARASHWSRLDGSRYRRFDTVAPTRS